MIARAVMVLALVTAASSAQADDTELFLTPAAENPAAARSNILFIVDTSGSMDTEVETQADWDPGVDFDGCYRRDAIYFSNGTDPPPCGSEAYIATNSNRCAAAAASFASRGQFTGRALAWQEAVQRWEPLAEGSTMAYLECQADRGIDGGGSSSALYAANGPDGPWLADDSREPAWNAQYTLFDGNWLNWRTSPPSVMRTRLQIVKSVVSQLVDSLEGVNVGLMQFNREDGGPVIHAVTDIARARGTLQDAIAGLATTGATPLSETLYEAALYLRGANVDFGNLDPVRSVAAARLGGNPDSPAYRSPVTETCQQNFIILLTDGTPTSDDKAPERIRSLPGFTALLGDCDGSGDGACLDDLAEYLYRTDVSSATEGPQNVVTYTIGFDIDLPLLASTARRGGGRYYLADDTGSLSGALTDLLAGIEGRAGTFVAPSIPPASFNRAASQRDVFVALFEPVTTAHWPGNLKKYSFEGGQLVDRLGAGVIDPLTGFFKNNITSFWSASVDGDRVTAGGAAERLPPPATRRIFTDIDGAALSSSGNRVATDNPQLTAARLGVTEAQRDALINWIRGADLVDLDNDGDLAESRRQMGDPLHVRPVVLDYGSTAETSRKIVFIATNDGFLHAIDAATGTELWAYLPGRLLARQNELLLDPLSPAKRYGLDGELRLVTRNLDGEPGISTADEAFLVFGMGRGGNAVFALDVRDPGAPELRWLVDSATPGMEGLGQTWAAPAIARIRIEGDSAPRSVVMLSGGYDDAQDNDGYRVDNAGNALFILDLATGIRLWSAGAEGLGHDLVLEDMTNSIPAAPKVIDLTGDGLADRLYVGDTGGRLWRFDILNGNPRRSLATGGVLASLGAADLAEPPPRAARRFYVTPDVVFVNCIRGTFLAINIGSGFRGHPLDTTIEDAFFSVRDPNVYGVLRNSDYGPPIRTSDLQDITDTPDAVVPDDAAGWRLRLAEDAGEKVLAPSTTLERSVFFTSFAPSRRPGSCAGGVGTNRSYQVDACNGRPINNLDGSTESGPLTLDDRYTTLNQAGIAPASTFLFSADGASGPTRCVGLECFPPEPGATTGLRRTFWYPEPAR